MRWRSCCLEEKEPRFRTRRAKMLNQIVPPHLLVLSSLARGAHQLRGDDKIVIAGRPLELSDQLQVWPQYLELVRGDIYSAAVRFLCGSSFPQPNDHIIWLGDAPPNPSALIIEDHCS